MSKGQPIDAGPSIEELKRAYDRHNGNTSAVAREFIPEWSRSKVYTALVDAGIHEPDRSPADIIRSENLGPEDLDELAGGSA